MSATTSATTKSAPEKVTTNRLYVGNLSYRVRWQTLKDYMRKAGDVVYADVLTDYNGRSKGCGIVEYKTAEEAQKAINELNDTELEGRKIFIREDREDKKSGKPPGASRPAAASAPAPARKEGSGRQIFVGNLSSKTGITDLSEAFEQFGAIDKIEIQEGKNGSRFALICFSTAEAAKNAIAEYNDEEFQGNTISVYLDKKL